MKDAVVYLEYILQALAAIEEIADQGEADLLREENRHQRAAILYYLHTLAEATQRLPDDWKQLYREMDWQGIGGLRNRLVHGY